jgi:uncharacterized protein (TIGR03067 family)
MRAALMIAVLAVAVPDRPDPTPKEARPLTEQLQGEWQMVSTLVGGQPDKISVRGDHVIVFKADQMHIGLRAKQLPAQFKYAFAVDATKKPASFDIIYQRTEKGKILPCIVKIEGEVLTLCYSRLGANDRPAEFASPRDTNIVLWQFKRVGK